VAAPREGHATSARAGASSSLPRYNGQLERKLGPIDAAAIVVSNVIGGGIFFVPVIVAQLVPHPAWMLSAWLAGGALAFVGAMAYAELAAVRPHAGGEYVYLRDAYGPLAAFLTGWTSFIAGFSGAIAASAIALADYVTRFVPAAAPAKPAIAISAIVTLTLIHVLGLGPGRLVQNLLAALKVTAIVMIVALGFSIGHGNAANFAAAGEASAVPWLLALVPVMFSYSGWNAAAYVAEEVRNPTRNVPLALALGTLAVIVLYLGLNALYIFAMPPAQLAALGDGRLMDTVAERLFGFATGNLLALFTIVSLAASISAMVLAGPRVYFARLFRHGPRRNFRPRRGTRSPAVPHAGDGDRGAGAVEHCPRDVRHAVAAGELHRIRGRALRRHRGEHALRAAPPRRWLGASILRVRLSVGAGDLHRRECADGGERVLAQSGDDARGAGADPARRPGLLCVPLGFFGRLAGC
jgi:hypothetical protein